MYVPPLFKHLLGRSINWPFRKAVQALKLTKIVVLASINIDSVERVL